MELVFRALGLAASANNALTRYRVNFIPISWILTGVAAAVCVTSVNGYLESVRNGREPQPVVVKDLGASADATFVRTSGTIYPNAGFKYGEEDANGNLKSVQMELVPLVDPATRQAVFVQLPPQHRFGTEESDVQVTGMLRPMQIFLARELRLSNYRYKGVQVVQGFVLVADETPGNAGAWQLGALLSGGVVALFLYLTLKRNTIFVRGAHASSEAAGQPGEMYATGTFTLDKHTRRFIDVPAALGQLESGEIAVVANVDASSSFMGVKYEDRSGLWMLPIAAGSIGAIQEGALYYGRTSRPALRFTYRDALSNRSRTAILTVPASHARATLIAELGTPSERAA
jgi:hypothetical protein